MKHTPKQTSGAGAYSQIAMHAAICLSMTLTCVDARPTAGGDEFSKGELVVERQKQQIENASKEGETSALEAEFMGLVRREYASPQARLTAISAWREDKGQAFDAEQEAKRAKHQPERYTMMANLGEYRKEQIKEMTESGRISAKEAKFMSLHQEEYGSPQARQLAIKAWYEMNGAALEAERYQKRALENPQRCDFLAKVREQRIRQIVKGANSGQLGSLEAELMALVNRDHLNPRERQQTIQTWQEAKGNALASEKEP